MRLLSKHVDTFKEALYINADFDKYNLFVDDLIKMKEHAQTIHDMNNDNRFVDLVISGMKWQIMATSISGYSVVMKNGDCSIALKKKGNKLTDRNPNMKIEYRAQFLVRFGLHGAHKQINDFVKQNIHNDYLSKVQEIHLACDTQGHSFDLFDVYRMKTRARKVIAHDGDDGDIGRKMVFTSRKLETLYFGTGSNMVRIYNKTAEEKKHPESGHIKQLWAFNNTGYDENKDVWRIEFQIRRVKLKGIFNAQNEPYDYTNVLLQNINGLWDFFISYFSYRDISQNTAIDLIKGYWTKKDGTQKLFTKQAEKDIFKKSLVHPLWELIKQFDQQETPYWFRFNQVKQSQPIYAMNAVCGLISTITKHYGSVTPEILNKVVMDAEYRSLKNNDVGLLDGAIAKQLDYFAKVEKQTRLGLDIIETPQDFTDNFQFFVWDAVSPLKLSSQFYS